MERRFARQELRQRLDQQGGVAGCVRSLDLHQQSLEERVRHLEHLTNSELVVGADGKWDYPPRP